MQRKIDDRRLGKIWVEHIVWNVVAATSLAFMIAILLWSLRWLDEIDADPEAELRNEAARRQTELGREIEGAATKVARVSGPSG